MAAHDCVQGNICRSLQISPAINTKSPIRLVELAISLRYAAVMSDVTRVLQKIESGDRQASSELLPLVYDELKKLAGARMVKERADHTLQATALVHEAYLRLVDRTAVSWDSRGHFFAAAAEAMRRILIDSARRKHCQKRDNGGRREMVSEITSELTAPSYLDSPERLLELDDALTKLESQDPEIAALVRLRLYAGVSISEAAQSLGVSQSTAYDWWNYAMAWFKVEMSD